MRDNITEQTTESATIFLILRYCFETACLEVVKTELVGWRNSREYVSYSAFSRKFLCLINEHALKPETTRARGDEDGVEGQHILRSFLKVMCKIAR